MLVPVLMPISFKSRKRFQISPARESIAGLQSRTSSTGRCVGHTQLMEEGRKALTDAMARRKERADVNTTRSRLVPNLITQLSNKASMVKTTGHKALVP